MSGSDGFTSKKSTFQQRIFRITDIPDVMQFRMGWPVAAQLMRRWFGSPAYQMHPDFKMNRMRVPATYIVDRAISMDWALRFGRVKIVHGDLLDGWANTAGLTVLREKILRTKPLVASGKPWRFGDLSRPAAALDNTCQVNIKTVGGLGDSLDEFYGAIGIGTLKIAVSGLVTPLSGGRSRIEIDEIGTYLRDTYDFNDDSFFSQPLGYWGFNGVERSPRLSWDIAIDEVFSHEDKNDSFYAVQNDDFREYRTKYRRGGDFIIYSDVYRIPQARPWVLEV